MRILISSLDGSSTDLEAEVGELRYESDNGNFWMPCVMGDDWLQRVNSCARLETSPRIVRSSDSTMFVVYDTGCEATEFYEWLGYATEQVQDGYRTMRG